MDWNRAYIYATNEAKHSFTFRANSVWVRQRAEDRKQTGSECGPDRVLAFAMGAHKRLGEISEIRFINADVLHSIVKIVIKSL